MCDIVRYCVILCERWSSSSKELHTKEKVDPYAINPPIGANHLLIAVSHTVIKCGSKNTLCWRRRTNCFVSVCAS